MDYVKVVDNKIVSFYRPRGTNLKRRPKGLEWKPLHIVETPYDASTEFLVHDYYEILEDKVIEHFKTTPINFEVEETEESFEE